MQSPPLLSDGQGQQQLAAQTANAAAPVPSDEIDDSHFRSKVAAARRRTREKEAQGIGLLLNSRGYPLRPGAQTCQMYVDYNKCAFGTSCIMNHPDNPKGDDNDTWSDFSDEGPKLNKRGYIRRPGRAICSFYQKSGHCGFGPSCRFDHPEGIDGPPAPAMATGAVADMATEVPGAMGNLNSLGYPRNSGKDQCRHYAMFGYCEYGAICRWDHPEPSELPPPPNGGQFHAAKGKGKGKGPLA